MAKEIILKKAEEVSQIAEKMKNSKAVVSFDYQGLTVEKFMQLRNNLRQSGCEVCVIKNNISRRASTELGYNNFASELKGPKAIVFSKDDIVAPAKGLFEFAKENEQVVIANGIVEGDEYTHEQLMVLATLPSRETLLTQLAAGMLGTLSQLAIGLNMLTEKEEA
ncbi:MAG: 50S ribosomal protein L10 [Anaeroplasmataceae bacterium]